jgi:hypothetical protein
MIPATQLVASTRSLSCPGENRTVHPTAITIDAPAVTAATQGHQLLLPRMGSIVAVIQCAAQVTSTTGPRGWSVGAGLGAAGGDSPPR